MFESQNTYPETDHELQTASADARPGLHPRDPRGTENLFALLSGRQPPHDGHRRRRNPPQARCRRHPAARPVARRHDPRRRRSTRTKRPCRPDEKEFRRSDDRLAPLQEKPGRGALQPADALVPRRLRPRRPPLRRRTGLPLHHRPQRHAPRRGRMRRLHLPLRQPGRRTLRRTRQGVRLREPVLQLVRKHLHYGPDHGTQPRKADLPSGARRVGRRLQTGHHGSRPRRLSGPLPARQRRNARTARRLRPLPQARGAGRTQPVANARARARRIHCLDRRQQSLPVAHGDRRPGGPRAARQRHGLPPGTRIQDRGHLVDQARKGGMGLVERLEPLRRGLRGRHQQRHLQILHRLRLAERHRIRDPRRGLGREQEGRPDAGGTRNRPPRTSGVRP